LSILQIWFSLPSVPVGLATPEAIERLNYVFRSLEPDGYKSAGATHGLIWRRFIGRLPSIGPAPSGRQPPPWKAGPGSGRM